MEHDRVPVRDAAGLVHFVDRLQPDGGDEHFDLEACWIAVRRWSVGRVDETEPVTCFVCLTRANI